MATPISAGARHVTIQATGLGVGTGPQGPPGPNTVPTDEAIAGFIADPASDARGALFDATPHRDAALLARGTADQALARGNRSIEWDDTTVLTEAWANLTAWSSGTFAQVSGGRLYSDSQGANSGANRAFSVPTGGSARAIFRVRTVSGVAGGGLCVGFTRDTAGAAFTSGAAAMRGIYFRPGDIATLNDGTVTVLASSVTGTVDWIVSAVVDPDWVTFTARTVGGTHEYRAKFTRTGWAVNNLSVFNSDARELTGNSIGSVAARLSMSTTPPSSLVEGVAPWCVWTSTGGVGIRVALPTNYDSRRPSPVAIMFHGNGSDETHWWSNSNGKAVAEALLADGYIVAAAAWTAATSTWGNDNGLTAYTTLYEYLREHFTIGPVVLYANSMGGIDSLNILARDTIPGILAWAGTVPTYDLAENHANALFTATIDTAYGGNYAVNSVGHDPALMNPQAFRRVPMWMLIATDDASVTPAANGYALEAAAAHSNDITVVEVTGGHSTASIASNASTIVSFFNNVLGR